MSGGRLTFWLVLILAGCASRPKSTAPQKDVFDPHLLVQQSPVIIPLRNAGNRQWQVEAEINGVKGWFAVDTGAENTIISPQFAEKIADSVAANKSPPPHSRPVQSTNRFFQATYLRLGGILYLDFAAPILNLDHINRAMHPPIDGILGNNVLRKTFCSLDWKNNRLTLDPGETARPPDAIPIVSQGHRVRLTAKINQQPVAFILDTGTYNSCLQTNEISALRIPAAAIRQIKAPQIDISESRVANQTEALLDEIEFGKIHRTKFPVMIWKENVLGMDLLESWVLTMDARNHWLLLTEPKSN